MKYITSHAREFMVIWVLVFSIVTIISLIRTNQVVHKIAQARTDNCKRSQALLHLYVKTRDEQIDDPSNPFAIYYNTHPGSRNLAHRQNTYFLNQFNEENCK